VAAESGRIARVPIVRPSFIACLLPLVLPVDRRPARGR
jgi:hypothetical protein